MTEASRKKILESLHIVGEGAPIFRDAKTDQFVVLLLEGEPGGVEGVIGFKEEFGTRIEAEAYVYGVRSAMESADLVLRVVTKQEWNPDSFASEDD